MQLYRHQLHGYSLLACLSIWFPLIDALYQRMQVKQATKTHTNGSSIDIMN